MSARSSETIRHIAKALAAAQRELHNPEPRHDGQIRRELPSGLALIEPYRFASLGDGLAVMRPVLGRHGLSFIQATRLESQSALLILETRIIHESGEWILADYPVAPIPQGSTSDPRELGAALTYARRQSLFSLIGIAPQNDTDGLSEGDRHRRGTNAIPPIARHLRRTDTAEQPAHEQPNNVTGNRQPLNKASDIGSAAAGLELATINRSSEEALRLHLDELDGLSSGEELRLWAAQRIKAIAGLLPQDRQRLNEAFRARRQLCGRSNTPERGDLQKRGDDMVAPGVVEPSAGKDLRSKSCELPANRSSMEPNGKGRRLQESDGPIATAERAQP